MFTLRVGLEWSLVAQAAVLVTSATTAGLTTVGWAVGLGCGIATNVAVARGLHRAPTDGFGPADLVTLARAALVCGVAALAADSFVQKPAVAALVTLAVAALVLDAVDGPVARRTRTTSTFGARFDGEVDAFLILVLSVYVARSAGAWVLAIGAARYAFAVAGWGFGWRHVALPPRYWRKVVAAIQGIVLTVAAAGIAPRPTTYAALAVALALLTESFGRDTWWSWRRSRVASADPGRASAEATVLPKRPARRE